MNKAAKRKRGSVWRYAIAVALIVVYLLPLYILLCQSFKTVSDPASLLSLPTVWYQGNYRDVLLDGDIWLGFKNSLILVLETVAMDILLSAMAAYGLIRSGARVAEWIQKTSTAVMMIPGIALLVGTYGLMVRLGMTNTLYGLSLLTAATMIPGTMFLYANFIKTIPQALDEAAAIDGAGVLRTFFTVIMPQLAPITVTRIIISATSCWNNYLMPMYLLQEKSKFSVILVVKQAFNQTNGFGNMPRACAACVIAITPVITAYLLLQRHIVEGQIDSAVK